MDSIVVSHFAIIQSIEESFFMIRRCYRAVFRSSSIGRRNGATKFFSGRPAVVRNDVKLFKAAFGPFTTMTVVASYRAAISHPKGRCLQRPPFRGQKATIHRSTEVIAQYAADGADQISPSYRSAIRRFDVRLKQLPPVLHQGGFTYQTTHETVQ